MEKFRGPNGRLLFWEDEANCGLPPKRIAKLLEDAKKAMEPDTINSKFGTIIIAGSNGGLSTAALEETLRQSNIHNVVIVNESSDNNYIYVDGKRYTLRECKNNSIPSLPINVLSTHGLVKEKQRPNVNIQREYKLIRSKKSKLSRKDREWVIKQFHRMYEEVKI